MRIRLNTVADRVELDFEGGDKNPHAAIDETKTMRLDQADGQGIEILVDTDGYVRHVRIAKLSDCLAELNLIPAILKP